MVSPTGATRRHVARQLVLIGDCLGLNLDLG